MNKNFVAPGVLMALRILFFSLSLCMVIFVVITSLHQNMFTVSLSQPWFKTTLVDYYFNVTLLIAWMWGKETKLVIKIGWALSFIILGSIGSCFYAFWQLMKVKAGDPWTKVFVS